MWPPHSPLSTDCRSRPCGWYCDVARSLWQRPIQLFAMPRLARDAAEGFRALRRCKELLGHGFGMHDLGELFGEVEAAI